MQPNNPYNLAREERYYAAAPSLHMTESELRSAKKNPYNKNIILDLILIFFGWLPVLLAAMFILTLLNRNEAAWFNRACLFAVLAAEAGFIALLIVHLHKHKLFKTAKFSFAAEEQRRAAAERARAIMEQNPCAQPPSTMDEVIGTYFNNDEDAAFGTLMEMFTWGEYSLVGGKENLKALVDSLPPERRKKYDTYALRYVLGNLKFLDAVKKSTVDVEQFNMTREEVLQAEENPYREKLQRPLLMLGAGVLIIAVGVAPLLLFSQSAYGTGRTVLICVGALVILAGAVCCLGTVTEIAENASKYKAFKKTRAQLLREAQENQQMNSPDGELN
jgi:uncharacterized membrane protein YqjE